MADRPEPLTELSFENSRAELIDRTNFIRASLGLDPVVDDHALNPFVMFIEHLALYCELTGAVLDNRTLAAIVVAARKFKDGTIAAESIGYNWKGVSPALVSINLDFGPSGHSQDVPLLDGHKFLSNPDYLLDGDITILAGTQQVDLPLRQVTKEQHTVISNGAQSQSFTMPKVPVVKLTATVTVDGTPFRVVTHSFELRVGEEGVEFRVDDEEKGLLLTGDGTNGKVILLGSSIVNDFETSLGSNGRIGPNTIDDTVDPIEDVLSAPVTPTITQPFGSSGGTDHESLESIKFNAPRSLRTLDASISREDFTTNAEEVEGVLRALVLTNIEDGSIPANQTLVLVASDAAGVGETTLFSDDHNDGTIPAGTWLQVSGVWSESGGEMSGAGASDIIRIDNFTSHFPFEFRSRCRAIDTTECKLVLLKVADLADYLFVSIVSDGAGNTTFKLGQVLSAITTENTSVESIDSEVLIDVVMRWNLNEGLVLEVDGNPILTFAADLSFRDKIIPEYRGKISVDQTDAVLLIDAPIPSQILVDEMLAFLKASRPTLVSHVVTGGALQFSPLNLEIDMIPLLGFTTTQARTNISDALKEYLRLTRKDENGEFANKPGITISLDEIYAVIRGAAGIDRSQILWPTVFDITPGPREMIIPGELKWT